MLDIDRFKQLNDTLGHPAGDQAIVTVAETLTDSFRAGHDLVVRYGGDEFAVLMLGMSLPQAEGRLRNVASRIAAVSFGPDDAPLQITVSSGAVELSAGDTRASLVERADQALYEAKRLGRNRVVAKAKPTLRDLMG
jgi:diguanylate cyclase (GGDEF)-like protein